MGLIRATTFVSGLWKTYVLETREKIDQESSDWQARHGKDAADFRLAVVLVTVMLCMIFNNYLGSAYRLRYWVDILTFLGMQESAKDLVHWVQQSPNARFNAKMFWALGRIISYIVPPLLVIKFVLREPIVDFGLRVKGILPHAKIYSVMLAAIAPLVVVVSFWPAFQKKYPFYPLQAGEAWWPNFICWEILYAMQFIALEFFFRGFLVHGAKYRLGFASIWLMTVPYMMIHYGKPMPECIGSIIAGLVLGTLSLKSKSVWWGAAIHIAVAWGMDLLSLWHRGLLG